MNILQLQLRAFGPFNDSIIDMDNGTGLCVTFGPNEAGKSSALRALRALLYGIPHNSPDNFLHEHNRMRIGGRLRHSDSSELIFLRRKGKKDTILSPEGKPIDDAVLDKFLHGVGEELFSRFFGIDHETLVRGGEDILKGEGEVGQSLFAAGLGGTGIRQVLQDLEKEADSLFRQRGQNQSINRAINDYNEAKKAISEVSLSSQKWSELDEALNKDIAKRDELTPELLRLRSEENRLARLQKALPKITKREELLASQRELGQVVQLPPEFAENRRHTIQKLQASQETLRENTIDIEELNKKVAELEVPGPLLDQAESIDELYQRLGSQRVAANDLGGLEGNLQQLKIDIQALLYEIRPDLTLEQVEELHLSTAERLHIQNLGGQHQTLMNNLQR
ncbi:MAG: AAA family ATPase, partial [Chloroflexota bacterium]|nr:AAA family ATPase [Chloroflexota bacterium]